MITRFYLENYLSFNKVDLEFEKGLIVFTGASGAGKSVLMSSILSLFGTTDSTSKLSEITLEDIDISDENYAIEKDDDIVIKQTTSAKTRYLLNNQTISKKNLKLFTSIFSKHLHLKDTTDFHSKKIVNFLDFLTSLKNEEYKDILEKFHSKYDEYKSMQDKLNKILEDEKDLDDLIEYTKFEIDKISKIDPKIDEYDELKAMKENLSKKEKFEDILKDIQPLLNQTDKISSALQVLDVDCSFFDDAIAEVNDHFERFYDSLSSSDEDDIENILTRIEELASLNKKFGGIEEALEYKKEKELELEKYDNISFEKAILEKNVKKLSDEINSLASKISKTRKENIVFLEEKINEYLEYLYLENLTISIETQNLDETGIDKIEFLLNNTQLSKISSGEFNRLRLALLTARSYYEIDTNGILFLDEIDANLSGKESQSIAKVLTQLSKNYQIFAISHQPQLSATANQHFIVKKDDNLSTVKLLNKDERIDEIARMISGENITTEALEFAKKLV
ncbi:MAG: DNA recombination protein RecN [Campylobacterota bacterium]|nr:DNA recombination protein RecN [Campylobacterota bacterium]